MSRALFITLLLVRLLLSRGGLAAQGGLESDTSSERKPESIKPGVELPISRCLMQQTKGLVPGLWSHRFENINLIAPLRELISEYKQLTNEEINVHERAPEFIVTKNPHKCLVFGKPSKWSTTDHALARKFRGTDALIMDTFASSGQGESVCISEDIVNVGDMCQKALSNMSSNGITLMSQLSDTGMETVYLQGHGTLMGVVGLGNKEENDDTDTTFVCKGTHLSRTHQGLITALKGIIKEFVKLTSALDFEGGGWGDLTSLDKCPGILVNNINQVYEFEGDLTQISGVCEDIWEDDRKGRSLISYLFSDDFKTIQHLMSTTNTNLKNVGILDRNLKRLFHWNNKFRKEATLMSKNLEFNIDAVKKSLFLQINFDNLRRYSDLLINEKSRKFQILFSMFNRIELIVLESRRRINKVMSRLSSSSPCSIDNGGKITCPVGPGVVDIEQGWAKIINRARKMNIKHVKQAQCLFNEEGHIFGFNNNLFVSDGKFLHNPLVSVPLNCSTISTDPVYDCSGYFKPGNADINPDQIDENIFYLLTAEGVYFQNLGAPTQIYSGDRVESRILSKEPMWVKKSDFPVQLTGHKLMEYDGLKSMSKEFNIEFMILNEDRNKAFDYGKYRELHKQALKVISFKKIYGSFSNLFQNNVTVRVLSIGSIITTSIIVLCLIVTGCFCCSRHRSGTRRYVFYSRRPGATSADSGGEGITSASAPAPSPPPQTDSRRSRRDRGAAGGRERSSNRERIQRLLGRV